MVTAIHRMVESARAGQDPTVITRMSSGWALFGRQQFVRGYALLLPDPVVPHLNALQGAARAVARRHGGTWPPASDTALFW